MKVSGSFALVTGASSGIGQATAVALARSGARLVVCLGRTYGDPQTAPQALRLVVRYYRTEFHDSSRVAWTFADMRERWGVPDIIVNAAGAGRFVALDESDLQEALDAMTVPYTAALCTAHRFLPDMIERGSGRIVNITSPAAIVPWAGATAYAASRWAVRGFTYALQQDLHGTGVGATLIIPGETETGYFAHNPGSRERIPRLSRLVPLLSPEDVASAIVRAIEREQNEVILPVMLRAFALMHRLMPGTVQYLVRTTGWQRP